MLIVWYKSVNFRCWRGCSELKSYNPEALNLLAPLQAVAGLLGLSSDDVFQETSARFRAVEPSSGSNVIPRRARPGLAGLVPQRVQAQVKPPYTLHPKPPNHAQLQRTGLRFGVWNLRCKGVGLRVWGTWVTGVPRP